MSLHTSLTNLGLALAVTLGAGCAEDIKPEPEPTPGESRITSSALGNGVTRSIVDATHEEDWVYMDLDTGLEVTVAAPATSPAWDLAFKRFQVKSNGGISGTGGVTAAKLSGADFDALTHAPAEGWIVDAEDSEDEGAEPDFVFLTDGFWYHYDLATHALTPADQAYVVKSSAGAYFKLAFLGYYDEVGSSGFPSFKWAPVAAPSAAADGTLQVNASVAGQWTYVSVANGVVEIADPATSLEWDFAVSRTAYKTNGGISGPGVGAARRAPEGVSYASLTSTGTLGFVADTPYDAGIPGQVGNGSPVLSFWYDYDSSTHAVTPADRVFVVRGADGDYAKLRITGWAAGIYTLQVAPIPHEAEIGTLEVDASASDAWVYVSLREGRIKNYGGPQEALQPIVEADPATSTSWDLAFNRVSVRTNGGTSGPGEAGALDAGIAAIADVTAVPADAEFVVDALSAPAYPPGAPAVSGNAVLNGWWDYNVETHVISPFDVTYLVRTADGDFAALKITTYAGGLYRLSLAYAGPDATTF